MLTVRIMQTCSRPPGTNKEISLWMNKTEIPWGGGKIHVLQKSGHFLPNPFKLIEQNGTCSNTLSQIYSWRNIFHTSHPKGWFNSMRRTMCSISMFLNRAAHKPFPHKAVGEEMGLWKASGVSPLHASLLIWVSSQPYIVAPLVAFLTINSSSLTESNFSGIRTGENFIS